MSQKCENQTGALSRSALALFIGMSLILNGCAKQLTPYGRARQADTIEAYEEFIRTSPHDPRVRFVREGERRELSVAQLCRDFGISRKTGYKWINRFRAQGAAGLEKCKHFRVRKNIAEEKNGNPGFSFGFTRAAGEDLPCIFNGLFHR